MKTIKTWVLTKDVYDESDILWLTSSGCKIDVKHAEPVNLSSASGAVYQYMNRRPTVEIKTISEKQETMLQLKYSNNLYLSRIEYEDIDMVPYGRSAAQ